MGNWLCNYHVRTGDAESICAAVEALAWAPTAVAAQAGAWATLFQEPGLPLRAQQRFAEVVSLRLCAPVLMWQISADDVTLCELWDRGRRRLTFHSQPDSSGPVSDHLWERTGGAPRILLRYAIRGTRLVDLKRALTRARAADSHGRLFAFERERIVALAPLLGIDISHAATSWNDLAEILRCQPMRILRHVNPHRRELARVAEFKARLLDDDLPSIQNLLDAGLDPRATDRLGVGLLETALNAEAHQVVRQLVSRGADGEVALHFYCAVGSIDKVGWLVAHGINVDAPNPAGYTPLLAAVASGREDVVRMLIAHGADVNGAHTVRHRVPPSVEAGLTPLALATRMHHHAIAAMLRLAGAVA